MRPGANDFQLAMLKDRRLRNESEKMARYIADSQRRSGFKGIGMGMSSQADIDSMNTLQSSDVPLGTQSKHVKDLI